MSATPTLLRVKRRKTEDPTDVLVLSSKKRKTDSDVDEEGNIKILKLAATIDANDTGIKLTETVTNILAKKNYPNFEELKNRYKKSLSSKSGSSAIKESKSKASEESRQDQRFRLVAQKRALKLDELEEWPSEADDNKETPKSEDDSEDKELFHLYDVVSDKNSDHENNSKDNKSSKEEKISCNGVEMIREYVDAQKSEEDYGYVYDVYYTDAIDGESADFDDSLLDNLVSIHPFNSGNDFNFDLYRDDLDEFKFDDDEDSNDEFNDKNDYPDEDDEDDDRYYCGYGDEDDDLDAGVKGMGLIDSDGELSSDEDDQLLYTRSFDEDVNSSGTAYAKFKQKMLKEFYDDEDDDIDDEDD